MKILNYFKWGKESAIRLAIYASFLVINLFEVIWRSEFARDAHLKVCCDAAHYITMSQTLFAPESNPFGLRVLSPSIVYFSRKYLHLGLNSSWLFLTYLSIVLSLVVFFKILKDHFRMSYFTSYISTLFLAFTFMFSSYHYSNYWLVDPLQNLIIVVALFFLFKRKFIFFLVIIALGTINKETVLLLLPLYPIYLFVKDNIRGQKLVGSILVSLLPIIFYILFKNEVIAKMSQPIVFAIGTGAKGSIIENIRFSVSHSRDTFIIFSVFNFMWFVFFYALYRFYKSHGLKTVPIAFSAYLFLALLVGRVFASDADRIFVMLAPVLFLTTAFIFEQAKTEEQRSIILILLFTYLAINFGWLGDRTDNNLMMVNTLAMFVFLHHFGTGGLVFHNQSEVGHFLESASDAKE